MRKVEFYELPRTLQDQLIAGFRSQFGPRPIAHQPGVRPTARYWVGFSGFALVLLVVLWIVGYGNLDSPLSGQPMPFVGGYVVLVAALIGCVLQALAHRAVVRGLPFAPGLYLFPANVIDARLPTLRVYPLTELKDASLSSGRIVLSFGSVKLSLSVEPAAAERVMQQVQQARRASRRTARRGRPPQHRSARAAGHREPARADPAVCAAEVHLAATEVDCRRGRGRRRRQRVVLRPQSPQRCPHVRRCPCRRRCCLVQALSRARLGASRRGREGAAAARGPARGGRRRLGGGHRRLRQAVPGYGDPERGDAGTSEGAGGSVREGTRRRQPRGAGRLRWHVSGPSPRQVPRRGAPRGLPAGPCQSTAR